MNRAIKQAAVQRYHYDAHSQLDRHLADFVNAYNFGRRLKTLRGFTPLEFHLQTMDHRTRKIQTQSNRPNAGLNI